MKRRIVMGLCLALIVGLPGPMRAAAQTTPGLVEARERAAELAQEISDLETDISDLEGESTQTAAALAELRDEVDALSSVVSVSAVEGFVLGHHETEALFLEDISEANRRQTLGGFALGADVDAMAQYPGLLEDLHVIQARHDEAQRALEQRHVELVETRDALATELERLEALERERLAELERQRREAERRRREEQERQRQQAAAQNQASSSSSSSPSSASEPSASPQPASPAASPSAPATAGRLAVCPVAGTHSFIDSWGYPRSGGRRHKGVDMMAAVGVPVVAPVSGTVSHRSNRVGGRSFHLNGDDGNYYYGTHLSGYGTSGWVAVGTVIGYVGDDGNARGIPHLHFEVHPGGGGAVNPYPYVAEVC